MLSKENQNGSNLNSKISNSRLKNRIQYLKRDAFPPTEAAVLQRRDQEERNPTRRRRPLTPKKARDHELGSTVAVMQLPKKHRLPEPTNVLFLLVATAAFLVCFLYADVRAKTMMVLFSGSQQQQHRVCNVNEEDGDNNTVSSSLPDFYSSTKVVCDVFRGSWVWDDDAYPLYRAPDCGFLDQGFRCSENGRPEDLYTKWRWQPDDCNLPRFNAKTMLEELRNRRLIFAGDSIGRNQWESLLCMLSTAIADKSSIYEVNGSPLSKHNGFLIFKFRDYNCTIEYYRAPFLVYQGRPPKGAPEEAKMTLKLDVMDSSSSRWKSADILIFNTGHWWNYEKTIRGGCYFEVGNEVKMKMSVQDAYRRSIETVIDWIEKEINQTKTKVIFRTYAPVHFSGGDWKSGGGCHLEKLPEQEHLFLQSQPWIQLLTVVTDTVSKYQQQRRKKPNVEVMNVSYMTAFRKDAHPSIYYIDVRTGQMSSISRQDCSHWCLPGVPDAWNELLYALLLRDSKRKLS